MFKKRADKPAPILAGVMAWLGTVALLWFGIPGWFPPLPWSAAVLLVGPLVVGWSRRNG